MQRNTFRKKGWLVVQGSVKLWYALPAFIMLMLVEQSANGQSAYVPINRDYYHLIDRLEIKQKDFSTQFFAATKPYRRDHIAAFIESFEANNLTLSKQDRFNLEYLKIDNWEWIDSAAANSQKPFLKNLYKQQPDMLFYRDNDFDLHVNPVVNAQISNDNNLSDRPFQLNRGLEIRGSINQKVGFYSYITESLLNPSLYVAQYIDQRDAIPGEGFLKQLGERGYDTFTARGYITFQATKNIEMQFGHDRNFIGNGQRSLALSDFADEYLFLKVQTKVWKLQYTNLFAQMIADNQKIGRIYPKKFMTAHHLGINILPNLNIGIFESVMFSRHDANNRNYYDIEYLNPIIFYRAVEQDLGDPDRVMVGLDFRWNLLGSLQLHGKFLLDEFRFDELTGGNNWWGNKYAVQLGAKYIDVANIDNLDFSLEYNTARPYMYTHFGDGNDHYRTNFAHFQQPLAHPLGANFREVLATLRYQPLPRLSIIATGLLMLQGKDIGNQNFGSDIFKDYTTRVAEYGNEVLQGNRAETRFVELRTTYQLRHNFFVELNHIYRNYSSQEASDTDYTTQLTTLGVRWNFPTHSAYY